MTKKDYVKIAAVLRDTTAPDYIVDAFADMLARDNPAFDRARFIAACK